MVVKKTREKENIKSILSIKLMTKNFILPYPRILSYKGRFIIVVAMKSFPSYSGLHSGDDCPMVFVVFLN